MSDFSWIWIAVGLVAIFALVLIIILVSVTKKGAVGNDGSTGPNGPTGAPGTADSQDLAKTASWTGAGPDVTSGVVMTRIGNTVTLFVEGSDSWVATTLGTNTMSTGVGFIPKVFRNNTSDQSFIVPTLLGGATTSGLLTVTVDGDLIFAPQLSGLGWNLGSISNGWLSVSVTYPLA